MNKKILLIGPIPPPYMGPSIATEMIIESELKTKYNLLHLNTTHIKGYSNLVSIKIRNLNHAIIQNIKL